MNGLIRVQAVERTIRRIRVRYVYRSGPETTLTIDRSIVKMDRGPIGFRVSYQVKFLVLGMPKSEPLGSSYHKAT
jgi:hypothetical protein